MENEGDRLKRLLEGTYTPTPKEEKAIKKAVPFNQRRQNLKQFLFTDTETLMDDIKQIYPAVGFITVVNNDDRDLTGVPRITTRALTRMSLITHKTQRYNRGKMYSEILTGVIGKFSFVVCVVQDGYVTIKKSEVKFRSG